MRLWTLGAAVCLLAGTGSAQVAEFSFSGGYSSFANNGSIGSLFGTDAFGNALSQPLSLDNGFKFAFRLTLNTYSHFGHEMGYSYSHSALNYNDGSQPQGMGIHTGFYDFLVYGTKEGSKIRPFVTGGGQFSNFVPPGSSVTSGGGSTKFGGNYGAGIKIRVTPIIGIRFDFRQYVSGKPFDLPSQSGVLRQNEFSAGVAFLM